MRDLPLLDGLIGWPRGVEGRHGRPWLAHLTPRAHHNRPHEVARHGCGRDSPILGGAYERARGGDQSPDLLGSTTTCHASSSRSSTGLPPSSSTSSLPTTFAHSTTSWRHGGGASCSSETRTTRPRSTTRSTSSRATG